MSADFISGKRERPQPDELGFDRRLLTPGRLHQLAGQHPVRLGLDGAGNAWLDCELCGKGVEQLTDGVHPYVFRPAQFLSNVLRHQVMSHGLSLSGGNSD
jgi:hypothetical protein